MHNLTYMQVISDPAQSKTAEKCCVPVFSGGGGGNFVDRVFSGGGGGSNFVDRNAKDKLHH